MKKVYAVLLALSLFFSSYAQTVWNGPVVVFTKANGADWTQPANQDRITSNVWITRATTGGIFNIATESSYANNTSPLGTEWAYGTLANYATLTYKPWQQWHGNNPLTALNQDAVVHLIGSNIYIGIKFTEWTIGPKNGAPDGGFAYERTSAPTLPVSLKSFNATINGTEANVTWKTATEINSKYFEVEHSTDGVKFTSIGRVNAIGSSTSERSYTFTQSNLSNGKNYYRLAQYDVNGDVKYSQVVLLSLNLVGKLQVKPNPAISFINVTASSSVAGATYSIRSVAGQIIKKGVLNSQQIDVQQLSPGQYFLSIQPAGGDILQTGFIKK